MQKPVILLFVLILTSVPNCKAENGLESIECPFPGGQAQSSEITCNLYTACVWNASRCHLQGNDKLGYTVTSSQEITARGFRVKLEKIDPSVTMFDNDVLNLWFEVIQHEDYHLEIKITDVDNDRYEVPVPLNLPITPESSPMYNLAVHDMGSHFEFEIHRISNGNTIFRTLGPLIYEDQFIQITTSLSSSYVYGFGESTHTSFKRTFDTSDPKHTYAIFARDQAVGTGDVNEYGHHPYYMVLEDDEGNAHSCLIHNSNAMEYSTFLLDDGSPALTLRTIGGVLDMHFFLGPTPEDVNKQYINTIGLPIFPTYQSLGFQLSRWGYTDTDDIRAVRQRMTDNGIPQDIQVLDIDYMENYRDFTNDPVNFADIDDLIQQLHDDGLQVTMMLDPAVVIDFDNYPPGQRGLDADVFIKWMTPDLVPDDQPTTCSDYIVGYVWPNNKTVFPDFFNPSTESWWINEMKIMHSQHDFDIIWIDMNEPANFGTDTPRPWNYPDGEPDWSLKCPYNNLDSPPYPTKSTYSGNSESNRLSDHSICMSSKQTDGVNTYRHYDVHSLYGWSQSVVTNTAMDQIFPGERHMILSRSTFPGSGQYVVHWLGDNAADWDQMGMSIIGMMEFNMFGMPYVGADICGFNGDAEEEMCQRWQELGAFYPFSRNHNADSSINQDPGMWPDTVAVAARESLLLRYRYLPYLYQLFYKAHTEGATVVRPLLNLYPQDLLVRDIDDQFMWADGLMIAPVLQKGITNRDVYFPDDLWYDLRTGALAATGPVLMNVNVPLDYIPVYARGGTILPFQEPDVTTTLSRLNPFGLTVVIDEEQEAKGEIFWDNGSKANDEENSFIAQMNFIQVRLEMLILRSSSYVDGLFLDTILFYGYDHNPTSIASSNADLDIQWSYDESTRVVNVTLHSPLSDGLLLTIQ